MFKIFSKTIKKAFTFSKSQNIMKMLLKKEDHYEVSKI